MSKRLILLCGFLFTVGVAWGDVDSLLVRGDSLFNQGRYSEAIAVYQQAAKEAPTKLIAHLKLGRAYSANGQYDEAISAYQRVIRLRRRGPVALLAYQELGTVYGKRGQVEDAVSALLQAAELAPDDFQTFYTLGAAYFQAGRVHDAFDTFTEALRLAKKAPQLPEAQRFVGQIEVALNELRPLVATAPPPPRQDKPAVKAEPLPPPKTYRLTIQTTPADSQVKILNIGPRYHPGIALESGSYHVQVEKPGYHRQRQWVEINDQDVTIDVALEAATYALTVQATPAQSQITLVGHPETYRPGMLLAPGLYQVRVDHEGYEPFEQAVEIRDRDEVVRVTLEPQKYAFQVHATPPDSQVQILNIIPPYEAGMRLPPGRYDVRVQRHGYVTWRQWMTVADRDVALDVNLSRTTYPLVVQVEPSDSRITLVNSVLSYEPGIPLPPGEYEVLVEREGYESERRTVAIRDRAVEIQVALQLRTYALTVEVTPSDSVIRFQNRDVTYEPGMQVPPGAYELEVTKPGYIPRRQQVTVVDRDVRIAVDLPLKVYGLTVKTTPPNSRVTLVDYAETYYPGIPLPPGSYKIVVEHEGYESARQSVEISSQAVSIEVALKIRTYALTVNATPPDSTVRIVNIQDRYRAGMRLRPGDYEVEVSRRGYFSTRQVVTVVDQNVVLEVALSPEVYGLTVMATPADSQITLVGLETPYQPGMLLPPGSYQVLVQREGYYEHQRNIRIRRSAVGMEVELEQIVHPLTVSTTPKDSRVTVVSHPEPYQPGMLLPQGSYEVMVEREGYETQRHPVTISDRVVQMQVSLKRIEYGLAVQVNPSDSQVQILNIKPAYTPGMRLPPGNYEVEVTKPGYEPWHERVAVVDQDVVVAADLEQTRYELTVGVTPTDSQIRLVNHAAAYHPGMLLPPGEHEVLVERDGYQSERRTVAIRDRAVEIEIALQLQTYALTVGVTPLESVVRFRNRDMTYEPGMRLPPGAYELDVTKPGYIPRRQTVTVVDRDVTLSVALERDVHPLVVAVTPDDSRVTLMDYAEMYYPGILLPPGSYEVVVDRDGYEPQRRTVTVRNEAVRLTIELRQATYALTVEATPEDSQITLVNYTEPYQPGLDLPPGRYEVLVERDGYQPVRREVIIRNRNITVKISLEKAPVLATQPLVDDMARLEAALAEQEQRYEKEWTQWSEARRKVEELEGAVGAHEGQASSHQLKLAQHREKLKRKQDQMLQDPSISLEPERTRFKEAWQAAKQSEEELTRLKEKVTVAQLDGQVLETRVEDTGRALDTLKQQLAQLRLQTVYRRIEQPEEIRARGEYRCRRHMSMAQCKQAALEEAKRDAVDKGTERLHSALADFQGIPQARLETLRQRSEMMILDYEVLNDDWVNKTNYFYQILAVVQGKVPPELRPQFDDNTSQGGVSLQAATPEPQTYKLTVRSVPQDSMVRLLGIETPYRLGMALAPGEYTLEVKRAGYYSHKQTVEIRDADVTIDVILDPSEVAASSGSIRRALVIGNAKYEQAPLRNPVNDAEDMSRALRRMGFKVDLLRDSTHREMEYRIEEFARHLRRGGIGLLYYAGHGVQLQGQNYLVPVDARLEGAADVKYRTVHLGWVLDQLDDARNDLNIVILDACRNNPFMRSWRSSQRGLAVVQAARGTLIAYSTSPGDVALDGDGRNGTFTKHLLAQITTPSLPVEQVFKQTRVGVMQETNGQQVPWESSSLLGDFFFVK